MLQDNLKELESSALNEINTGSSSEEVEKIRVKYLGKKGELTNVLKSISSIPADQRPIVGKFANDVRFKLEEALDKKNQEIQDQERVKKMNTESIDISITKKDKRQYGHKHPLTLVLDDMKEIFIGMGYSIEEGPEIEYTKFNFDALNTPKDHPSRDLQDTMYISDDIVLRTQTSPVQVRTMLKQKPPIKVIVPGRVYRSDSVDATHSPMFHQVEGLVVDKNISMSDLKGTLEMFAKSYFGENTKIRLRPHHFPFTEPSAEVDVSCFVCGGKGCKVCKNEGWIEILGAGMVHPNVLRAGGIDPTVYSGFAFGMGLERIAMTKFGINDLRYLYENDIRFLKQF